MELDKVLEKIINNEISIRQASEKYGYSREQLSKSLKEKYGLERATEQLNDLKANSTKKEVDKEILKDIYFKIISGKMTGIEARKRLGISDKETLRTVLLEYIEQSDCIKEIEQYKEYKEKVGRDYSGINFRTVAIDMIRANYSQSQMAEVMHVKPRTLSRQFEKFKNDEDDSLYKFIKVYSFEKMRRHEFDKETRQKHLMFLDMYERNHPELLEEPKESNTEKKNREEDELITKVGQLIKKGYSTKQITTELGVSVSSIRRAKIHKEKRDFLANAVNNSNSQKEENGDDRSYA